MLTKIKAAAAKLRDLVLCMVLTRASRYRVYYIEGELGDVGGLKLVNFRLHPVHFAEHDFIGGLSVAVPIADTNVVEAEGIQALISDRLNNMVYVIDSRLFGGRSGRDEVSLIDAKYHCGRRNELLGRFWAQLAIR